MISPSLEYKENNHNIYIYELNGYEIKLTSFVNYLTGLPYLSVDSKCTYEDDIPYPELFYNRASNKLESKFNSLFSLTENNKEKWLKSIENVSDVITKMNEVLINFADLSKTDYELENEL